MLPPTETMRIIDFQGKVLRDIPKVSRAILLRIYRVMMTVRLVDERMLILHRQGRVGFYGACTGQEAPPVATAAALQEEDWIIPGLREGAAMLYRGYPLELYLAQVFGNGLDPMRGRQMPSHQAARAVRQFSWSSCIGTQVPHAVGVGIAMSRRGDGSIAVGFMGDGATSTADVHRGLWAAAHFRSRCILICQNNYWAISQPMRSQTRSRTLAERAYAYGIPFVRIDGNDAVAVYQGVGEAAEYVRADKGPVFLEMETYRMGAHSSADDPQLYRDNQEVASWKQRDPLVRLYTFLLDSGWWTETEDELLKQKIGQSITRSLEVLEPWPIAPIEVGYGR